ncbi:MAG: hypothetical protein IPG58_15130 [Acidobacteria bacterium]|nr:hypothetical protein [Acidobacteriota bacterium]
MDFVKSNHFFKGRGEKGGFEGPPRGAAPPPAPPPPRGGRGGAKDLNVHRLET